jgi:hypothetical protein
MPREDGAIRYRAAQHDRDACMLKPSAVRVCSHARLRDPFMKPLMIRPVRSLAPRPTPSRVENERRSRCSHLKRIIRLGRLRLRGPNGSKDEFLLAATAQKLRKLAKLIPHPAPIFAHVAVERRPLRRLEATKQVLRRLIDDSIDVRRLSLQVVT